MTRRTAAQQLRLIFAGQEHGDPALRASLARELLEEHDRLAGPPAAEWTDPEPGDVYDLTAQYVDRDGDIWEISGWLHWTDGYRVPVFSSAGYPQNVGLQDVRLPYVIESYGPLEVRAAAAKAAL